MHAVTTARRKVLARPVKASLELVLDQRYCLLYATHAGPCLGIPFHRDMFLLVLANQSSSCSCGQKPITVLSPNPTILQMELDRCLKIHVPYSSEITPT